MQTDTSKSGLLHGITAPSLVEHASLIFSGNETAVIRDYEVEIAAKASMSRPVVQAVFRGLTFATRPNVVGQACGADLRVCLVHIPRASRQPTAHDSGGDLHHISAHKAEFQNSGKLTTNTLQLGWGPDLDGQAELRSFQTLRSRKL